MHTGFAARAYFDPRHSSADHLAALVATVTPQGMYPLASEIVQEVVVYDGDLVRDAATDPARRLELMGEIASVLRDGSGIVTIRNAVERESLDRTTAVFQQFVDEQRAGGAAEGDFFAAAGANDRIWNALEKLAVAAPECFVDYYGSEAIALACEAWLGPAYQMTSQINVVNPGGVAQSPHRDYHLGFMSDESAAIYPAHAHALSPLLTLQGAVAHCEMSVESGPTKLLPHSHKYPPGYVVWKQPEVIALFEAKHVQLPLAAGDAVFFCPAVYHAAGSNHTADVKRMANLLQVSSAFGRAMESIDRARMTQAIYPVLRSRRAAGWARGPLDAAIAACAEGYAFPTNLDRDPPIGGLAPHSQVDVLRRALDEGWSDDQLAAALVAHDERRAPVSG